MTKTLRTANDLLARMHTCSDYLESRRAHQETDLAKLMLFDKIGKAHSYIEKLQGITNLCHELQITNELLLIPAFEEMEKFATTIEIHKA